MARSYQICTGCWKRLSPKEKKNGLYANTSSGYGLVCKYCYDQWREPTVREIFDSLDKFDRVLAKMGDK